MQKRDAQVELFRVLATVLVVLLHVLGQGGILTQAPKNGAAYWVAWFLEIVAYCAVNCFAIISGYVMVNKTTKLKNIIGLWFQIAFYSLLISGLCFRLFPESLTLKNLIFAFLPILGRQWWYVSAYFAVFFAIPILNAAINNISQKAFTKFLVLVLLGICIADCAVPADPFILNGGYSPIWLAILYLVGAYIRKYDLKEKITPGKSVIGFFIMILLTYLSKLCIYFASQKVFGYVKFDDAFVAYISITIVLAAVFLFLFCLNVKLGNGVKKVILFLSPATLGVYLLHAHPLVFEYVLKDAFAAWLHEPLGLMLVYVLAVTLGIFLLCSGIDLLRIQLFRLMKLDRLSEKIATAAARIWQKAFSEL